MGKCALQVRIAATDKERKQGLMGVTEMPKDHGMLFVYAETKPRAFWMRHTPLDLDIIFMKEDGLVCDVLKAKALDETPLKSACSARYVLEIRAGQAQACGVQKGIVARL